MDDNNDNTITNKRKYRRSLGLFELVAFGLGGTIGSGIFIVPSISASIAGPSSILAWILACASASTVMYSLAKTSFKYPSTGAFYSIFSNIFNKKISIFLVLMYLISCIFGISTVASGIGQYVYSIVFNNFNNNAFNSGNRIIQINSIDITIILFIVEISLIIGFCILNVKGVSISGKAENILTIVKVAPLVILTIVLIPYIRESNFFPFFSSYTATTSSINNTISFDFLKALVIVYLPISGFEICAIPSEETKGEQKVSIKSMKIVMGIVILIYISLNTSLIGSLGSKVLANSSAPIATAAGLVLKQSQIFVAIIGIIAMLSALNAYMIAASRVLQNLSSSFKNRYLNQIKELNPAGTPVASIIIISSISSILLVLFSAHFERLADISVIMTLVPYLFVCLAAYKLFSNNTKTKIIAGFGVIAMTVIITIYFI